MTSLPMIPISPDAPTAAGNPRRAAMPPRHLADLDLAGSAALPSPDLGEPAFRARQLSTHYFGRLVRDPAAMTDLPGRDPRPARRRAAADAC